MIFHHAALLARLPRSLERDLLERLVGEVASGIDGSRFERVEANVALDGSRTHLYFWTGSPELPAESLRGAVLEKVKYEAPDIEVVRLEPVLDIRGADFGKSAGYHYVVEADADEANEQELADWYEKEHLPALAAVPGNIRSRRLINVDGAPRSFACYDLVSPEVLKTRAWLSVRETQWSSRVRPMFRNPRRTVFERVLTLEL